MGTSLMRPPPPRRTLQDAGAQGPVVVPGDRWFLMGEVTLYSLLEGQYCSHQFGPSRSSSFQHRRTLDIGSLLYRGTPLIIKYPFLGPYSSPMHRALWWSWGAGDFLWLRYPCSRRAPHRCSVRLAFSASGFGLRGSKRLRGLGFGFRASGFGIRDSGFGIRASGFVCHA